MKNKLIAFIILSGIILFSACTNQSDTAAKGTDSTDSKSGTAATGGSQQSSDSGARRSSHATDSSKHLEGPAPDTADIKFLKKATSGGRMEVQLGLLAGQNGTSPRVKSFGEMMIKDHTDANINLKNIVEQLHLNISDSLLPAHEHHKMMLSAKKNADFDKAYMKMMVEDHKDDITDFQKARTSSNPRIRNFAMQTLPVLIKHLDSAKAIAAGRYK